jgi:hypothetical protein
MDKCSKPYHATVQQGHDAPPMDEVVYLVKRPGYAFMLGRPSIRSHEVSEQGRSWHVRFCDRHGCQAGDLDLAGLHDFYDSLSQLMDYIRIEQERASTEMRCATQT